MLNECIEFCLISTLNDPRDTAQVTQLLASVGLMREATIPEFIIAKLDQNVIACAGIDKNIIKCIAIMPDYQGSCLSLTLIEHVIKFSAEQGYFHLFLFTKPENIDFFKGCGFYPIVVVPNLVVLMENLPTGIAHYCQQLQKNSHGLSTVGHNISSIVMNANPFTNGHRYLVEQAALQSDWLHIFVVQEDVSMFSFTDRFELVKQGVSHLHNVSVHAGSHYLISKVTFPSYFLKDSSKIITASVAIDLLLFRNYIAPALNIQQRFVGTEPDCVVTHDYNLAMQFWLQDLKVSQHASIDVVEICRKQIDQAIISASKVRYLLRNHQYSAIHKLVPEPTWSLLKNKYMPLS